MFTELLKESKSFIWWMILGFLPILSGYIAQPTAEFFEMARPEFYPPNWLFGVVWSILYAHIGFAAYLAYGGKCGDTLMTSSKSLKYFIMHIVLNFLWPILFFALGMPLLALINILLLIFVVGLWLKHLYTENSLASLVALPYFTWLIFATLLNIAFITLN